MLTYSILYGSEKAQSLIGLSVDSRRVYYKNDYRKRTILIRACDSDVPEKSERWQMLKELFERLREGDKVFRGRHNAYIFTVVASNPEENRVTFSRHVQLSSPDIKKWTFSNKKPIVDVESLKTGDIITQIRSDIEYVVVKAISDHIHCVCIIEAKSDDAKHWHLVAKVQLKPT